MRKGMTPIERLEFALRWENVRLLYFQMHNNKRKAENLTAKIKEIESEINAINYQSKEHNESAYK